MSDVTTAEMRWRRLDVPGRDVASLVRERAGWRLQGTATFEHDGDPCELRYEVRCDAAWITSSASVRGRIGSRAVAVDLAADEGRRWLENGVELPAVAGCLDVDLAFTPATNLLPIRRLSLSTGREAEARAAWLSFPALEIELLVQRYVRIGARTYRYESDGGRFGRELEVDENGFATRYEGRWEAEVG